MATVKAPITQSVTAAGIQAMLLAHHENMMTMLKERAGTERLQKLCDSLAKDRCLSFAVQEIETNLTKVLETSTRFDNRIFIQEANCHVAVLVLPAVAPTDAMAYMPNGYVAILGRYLQNLQYIPNNLLGQAPPKHWASLGHWIYCCDGKHAGAHLSLVLDIQNPAPGAKQFILAQDLLNQNERQQLRL